MANMASAPPMETAGPPPATWTPSTPMDPLQPPSYEESTSPQYTHGPGLPPAYAKNAYQPYPAPGYGQAYQPYPPPPAHTPINPIVSVQTIYVQPGGIFGDVPVHIHCPACAQTVQSRLEHKSGVLTWLACAGLFVFGCVYGCCLIPFCVDGLKDVTHRCPNCNNVLGIYKRLNS